MKCIRKGHARHVLLYAVMYGIVFSVVFFSAFVFVSFDPFFQQKHVHTHIAHINRLRPISPKKESSEPFHVRTLKIVACSLWKPLHIFIELNEKEEEKCCGAEYGKCALFSIQNMSTIFLFFYLSFALSIMCVRLCVICRAFEILFLQFFLHFLSLVCLPLAVLVWLCLHSIAKGQQQNLLRS